MAQSSIPHARPEQISDAALRSIRDKVYDARRGAPVSDAEAAYVVTSLGPLLDELLFHRDVSSQILEHLNDNVVYLEEIAAK